MIIKSINIYIIIYRFNLINLRKLRTLIRYLIKGRFRLRGYIK